MIGNTKQIGLLGGGQLGAMLIRSAIDFGIEIQVMDKDRKVSSAKYTSLFVQGDTLDYDDVYNFGKKLDIITIEKEAVNVDALKDLEKIGVKVYPSPATIEIIQDKYHQKEFLIANKIPVAKGIPVHGIEELKCNIKTYPVCLKKRRDGYDGNGVMMLHSEDEIKDAFTTPSVIEECIDIQDELSVIVARNQQGDITCYDATMMVFDTVKHLLDYQISPASIEPNILREANSIARKVAEAIDLVGILAVEMFVTKDGKILVNELAPRPHNSGHHTIESATTSQYEQMLRAILGLPLGSTTLNKSSVLVNVLEPKKQNKEQVYNYLNTLLDSEGVHVHWYGKEENIEGRKMGHIVVTNNNIHDALTKAESIRKMIKTI